MRAGIAALLAAAVGLACDGSGPATEDGALARLEAPDRWQIVLLGPGRLRPGDAAQLRLAVEPRGPWKLAEEYPLRLELEGGAGLEIAAPTQTVADATRFDASGCEFAVDVTARETGTHRGRAEVRFGICEADLCEPVAREVEFSLRVE